MDKNSAVQLLTQWISFIGMDCEDGWKVGPGETPVWPRVNNTRRAIEYAIQIMTNNQVNNNSLFLNVNHQQAIDLISTWPKYNGMNDSISWEDDDLPFIQKCVYAMEFTVDFLKSVNR